VRALHPPSSLPLKCASSDDVRPHAHAQERDRAHCAARARQLRCARLGASIVPIRGWETGLILRRCARRWPRTLSKIPPSSTRRSRRAFRPALANPCVGAHLPPPAPSTPLKKVAQPADIARQIAVLASARVSGHVSGQVLMIEGGMEGRVLNSPGDLGLVVPGH
jgi:hypothetical protein